MTATATLPSYKSFVEDQKRASDSFRKISERLSRVSGESVLLFSHDDPDGLTSGAILVRMLSALGAKPFWYLSSLYELEDKELERELARSQAKLLLVTDKGTVKDYDLYVERVGEVIVIDHHPPQGGELTKALWYNPATPKYISTCTAQLAHMFATDLGVCQPYDDFLALVGMKSDWAIEPATDYAAPFCQALYAQTAGRFPNLVRKIQSKPTMFEVKQRNHTTLLNQIAEFAFAVSGGGFQYFYNDRVEELKNIYQPNTAFQAFLDAGEKNVRMDALVSLEEFLEEFPDSKRMKKMWRCYLEDWELASRMFSTVTPLARFGESQIYLFMGNEVPLLPMAGSVKLYETALRNKDKNAVFVMVNREKNGGTHFSLRATGNLIHSGMICGNLAERLVAKFGHKGTISGGGHPLAAECKTRTSGVPMHLALLEFFELMKDMGDLAMKPTLTEEERRRAKSLALDYLS